MKNRKCLLYIIVSLFTFLITNSFVYAGGIGNNSYVDILNDGIYPNLQCDIVNQEGVAGYYKLEKQDKGYRLSTGNSSEAAYVEVKCTYGKKNERERTYKYSKGADEYTTEGEIVFKTFMSLQFHETPTYLFQDANIHPREVRFSGKEGSFWSATLSGSDIKIAFKDGVSYRDEILTDGFTFVYVDDAGVEHNGRAIITFDLSGLISAYPGNITCEFDSSWTQGKNNNVNTYYQKKANADGSIYLPNCSVNKYGGEFKGWSLGKTYSGTTASCESELVTTGAGSVTPKQGEFKYYACFTYKNPTSLMYTKYGTINSSDWIKSEDDLTWWPKDYNAASYTLPEFTSTTDNLEFKGWQSGNGEILDAGTVVPNDGKRYRVVFSHLGGYVDINEYMFVVSISESKALSVSGVKLSSPSVSGNSGAIEIIESGGEIFAKGVSPTDENDPAIITVKGDNGKEYTFKVLVKKNSAYTTGQLILDWSSGTWYDASESGPTGGAYVPGLGSGGSSGVVSSDACTYTVDGSEEPAHADNPTDSYLYWVKVQCPGKTDQRVGSLCLDPGKNSPKSKMVVERVLDPSTGRNLDKVAYAIYQEWGDKGAVDKMSDLKSQDRLEANIAVRIASFADEGCNGSQLGGTSDYWKRRVQFFNKMCKLYTDEKEIPRTDVSTDGGTVKWIPTSIEKVNKWLKEGRSFTADDTKPTKIDYKVHEIKRNGSDYSAVIELDTSIELASIQVVCPDGGVCGKSEDGNKITLTYSGSTEPTSSNWGILITPSNNSYGKLLLLKPVVNLNAQRLIILGNIDSNVFIGVFKGDTICPETWEEIKSNPSLYIPKCCAMVTDPAIRATKEWREACNTNCVQYQYSNVCDLSKTTAGVRDDLFVKEAATDEGDKYGACVVFTEGDKTGGIKNDQAMAHTDTLTDFTGNKYSVGNYSSGDTKNKYCRYSCSEEWQWSFESYGSFIGDHAKFAGSFFQVDKEVYLRNKVVCVSTYVDYAKYMYDMEQLTTDLVALYNMYSEVGQVLYDVDYGASADSEPHSSEDNRKIEDLTCYYYGSSFDQYTEQNDFGKCGEDGTGTSVDSCSATIDPTSTDDLSEYCVSVTDEKDKNADGSCDTGYSVNSSGKCEKTTYTYHKAKTCYGKDGGYSSIDEFSFDCWDYHVIHTSSYKYGVKTNYGVAEKDGEGFKISSHGTASENRTGEPNDIDWSFGFSKGSEVELNAQGYFTSKPGSSNNTNCSDKHSDLCTLNTDSHDGTATKDSSKKFFDYLVENNNYSTVDHSSEFGATVTGFEDLNNYSVNSTLKEDLNNIAGRMTVVQNAIVTLAKQFDECQNAGITNSKGSHVADLKNSTFSNGIVNFEANAAISVGPTNYVSKGYKINMAYDPQITYTYDESMYTDMIGADNKLLENFDAYGYRNPDGSRMIHSYDDACSGSDSSKCENIVYNNLDDDYPIILNKHDEDKFYKDDSGWKTDSDNARNYSGDAAEKADNISQVLLMCGGKTVTDWTGRNYQATDGKLECEDANFYYYEVNYNYLSNENAAFYSNQGVWITDGLSDKKVHILTNDKNTVLDDDPDLKVHKYNADMKSKMKSTADTYGEKTDSWTTIGSNHNVFPIRFDTPRDRYQYAYSFKDIGTYPESLELGRIQGYANSVLEYSTYSCFYEVREDFCECCGAKINTTVAELTHVDTRSTINDYAFSSFDGEDQVGDLGFYTSSVSLYDLDGDDREMLANWKEDMGIYYLTEKVGTTDRGSDLRTYIEEKGDTVYDETNKKFIEYTYTLKPGQISKLRNTNFTYGIVTAEVEPVGTYNYYSADQMSQGGNGNVNSTDTDIGVPRFSHYRSTFLEKEMKDFVTPGFEHDVYTNINSNYVCAIDNIDQLDSKRGSCRWIDWVEGDYRLAFK